MSAVDKVENQKNYVNLAQLYRAIHRDERKKFIQSMIDHQDDINYKIPITDFFEFHQPDLIGCTALHLAFSADHYISFNLLLAHGADYNVKDNKQMSVLRRVVDENFSKHEIMKLRSRFTEYSKDFTVDEVNGFVVMQRIIEGENYNKHENWRLWGEFEDKYLNSILESRKIECDSKYLNCDRVYLFHAACLANNIEVLNFFLKDEVDVNQTSTSPIFHGFTPLHSAVKYSNLEVVRTLVSNETRLFSWDKNFMSPLDMLVDQNLKIIEWLHAKHQLPYKNALFDLLENEEKINLLVTRFEKTNAFQLSTLHVVCTSTNRSSVRSTNRDPLSFAEFMEGDHSQVDQHVLPDSAVHPWSGYSALHFAAIFNIETAKLLISKGADITAKNKKGVTPLDILATRATIDDLHFIISHIESWKSITFSDGRTTLLDLISSMKDECTFDDFLRGVDINLSIPVDSPLWPGYTILHLVVTFSETSRKLRFLNDIFNSDRNNLHSEFVVGCREQWIDYYRRIEICLMKNACFTLQDPHGRTAINLAFRQRKMYAVKLLLEQYSGADNPTDDDNLSHLHIACSAKNRDVVQILLTNGADVNAAVKSTFKWQSDYYDCTSTDVFELHGSTPLHLAVISGNVNLLKLLLEEGADVNAKDCLGLTALHRIFILRNIWQIADDLYKVPVGGVRYVQRRGRHNGISCYAAVSEALHEMGAALFLSPNFKESIVDDCGLSHMHVAMFENNNDAVKMLLDLGSSIDPVIRCCEKLDAHNPLSVLSRYDGWTPLHISCVRYIPQLEMSLLEKGADILLTRSDGMNQLFSQLQNSHPETMEFFNVAIRQNEALRQRLQDEFGWTILHVACQLLDTDLARDAFSRGINLHLRTKETSPIHPGCTALHVLMMNCHQTQYSTEDGLEIILATLLANAADVMMTDPRGNTALHRSDFTPGCRGRSYADSIYTGRLLRTLQNFDVNPINHEGVSVFHIVCIRHDVAAVEQFLNHGVDVNQPIEFFSDYHAGCTALHLAAKSRSRFTGNLEAQLQTVTLLLERGADVHAVDAYGNTPLHAALECTPPRIATLEMIVGNGADVHAKNAFGTTPFELLSSSRMDEEELELFMNQGCRVNTFNEITQFGCMSSIFLGDSDFDENDDVMQILLSCPSINQADSEGRTALHNVVSSWSGVNDDTVKYILDRGCDIDRQDSLGMTALHRAARFRNYRGVEALLMYRADINIVDSSGKTALVYTLDSEPLCDLLDRATHNHSLVIQSFARFLHHMNRRGLYVNEINIQTLVRATNENRINYSGIIVDYDQLSSRKIDNTAFTLENFLAETNAIVYYSKIAQKDREAIERFFRTTVHEHELYNWKFLCKMQYQKALQRPELVEIAKDAMNVVIGFALPDLCYDVIEKFLSNADLKSLIAASD